MDEPPPIPRQSNDEGRGLAAGIADGLLVFAPALGLAKKITLPHAESTEAFMSGALRAGIDPLTNYVQFALCAIVVWGAFWLGLRRGRPIVAWIADLVKRRSGVSRAKRIGTSMLAAAAAAVYLINVTGVTLDGPLVDGFHEGQYLGYVPALDAGAPVLASLFIIHGPGVDLLPGILAGAAARFGHGIVATRFAYAGLRTGAVIASLLAVLLFARLASPGRPRPEWLAASALAFMVLALALQTGSGPDVPVYHKAPNARDAAYLLQVVLVLGFALAQQQQRAATIALALAAVAGMLAPWAVMYSYDRGLYGALFLLLASLVFVAAGGSWARRWLAGAAFGVAIGSAALFALFGRQGIAAVLEQIAFWVRYGREIWAYPGLTFEPDTLAGMLVAGALVALAIVATQMFRALAAAGNVAAGVRNQVGAMLMLAASILPLRPAIERSDLGHVAWGVTASWIMLSVLIALFTLRALQSLPRGRVPSAGATPAAALVAIAASLVVGSNLAFLDPGAAWTQIRERYYGKLWTSDAAILSPEQRQAMEFLQNELRGSPCFYALTNHSSWYYLVRKPACARFDQVTNARPAAAQREVVAALEAGAPPVVLFASRSFANLLDGISNFDANPIVMQYVLGRFAPDRWVGDSWIWRRSEAPLRFSDRRIGAITAAAATGTHARDLVVTGTYGHDAAVAPAQAIFVTAGDANAPIWAGPAEPGELAAGRWSATVPTAALAAGRHRLRVWALWDGRTPLTQLGADIELELR